MFGIIGIGVAALVAHNTTEFTLERRGDSTDVTWAMFGMSIRRIFIRRITKETYRCVS